jgi:hypothetical protein
MMRNPKDSAPHRVVFTSGFSTGTRRMSDEKANKRGKSLKESGSIETL